MSQTAFSGIFLFFRLPYFTTGNMKPTNEYLGKAAVTRQMSFAKFYKHSNGCRKNTRQTPNNHSWLKTPSKLGIKENFLNLIKNIHKNPIANILNGKRLNTSPPRIRMKARMSACDILIQHSTRSPSWCDKAIK